MLWRSSSHKRIIQIADALTTAASLALAFFLWDAFRRKTGIPRPMTLSEYTYLAILGISIGWVLLFSLQRGYSYQRLTSLSREISIVAKTTLYGIIILMLSNFLFRFGHMPRTFVAFFAVVSFVGLSLEKTSLFYMAKIIRKTRNNKRRVLVVGPGNKAHEFLETVERDSGQGLSVVGLVSFDPVDVPKTEGDLRILGDVSRIESILHDHIVDEVVICDPDGNLGRISAIIECCAREGVQVRVYSDYFSKIAKRIKVDDFYGLKIISFINIPDDEMALFFKRIMDLSISGILMVLLAPAFAIISILIKSGSKGPVFYRWNVVGLNKKPFRSWKFRTMSAEADELKKDLMDKNEMNGPVFKIKDDPRITKVGKILRKFSLDELPQLWSVFKGDMSLVGPRPAGPHELARYESWHRRKLSIKPGLTCLWQVGGRNQIRDFDEWVKLDLAYIENWSLGLDLKILLRTIPAVLRGTGV